MTAKNKSEVPRVYFLMMKKKIDWDKPKTGLLNSINAISQTIKVYLREIAQDKRNPDPEIRHL